jgi:hypothetical protein
VEGVEVRVSDWPKPTSPYGNGAMVISPLSPLSLGSAVWLASNTTPGSLAWPAANRVLLTPFRLPEMRTCYQIVAGNGATAAGNFDVGIYDASGNRIVSKGSTVKVSSGEVVCDITDTVLLPGLYYMALQADATGNYIGIAAANAGLVKAVGQYEANPGSFPLPSTLTFATNAGTLIHTGIGLYFTAK